MELTNAAKKYFAAKRSLDVYVTIKSNELADPSVATGVAEK
jgi:hypothetical protein